MCALSILVFRDYDPRLIDKYKVVHWKRAHNDDHSLDDVLVAFASRRISSENDMVVNLRNRLISRG